MDEAAFQACYEAVRGPLWGYLHRLGAAPDAADDLVQEAFMRLLQHPPRAADARSARAWLYTTATRLLRDRWRRQAAPGGWRGWFASAEADAEAFDAIPDPAPHPLERLASDQLLERGFAALSPRQRSLLWLALVEGLDHGDIAEALGLRKGSVKVLLSRARERFAAALEIPGQLR